MRRKKIIFSDNTLWGLVNFRGDVILHFVQMGFEVILVAPQDENSFMKTVVPEGVRYIPVGLDRCSVNVLHDVSYLKQLYLIYKNERPDYVFHYTIKPNIYGALVASFLHIPSSCMIAGLGYALQGNKLKHKLASKFYSLGMAAAEHVFVLNDSIVEFVLEKKMCRPDKLIHLKGGEGVSLERFPVCHQNAESTVFLMIGRLLIEKGYREFIQAAKRVLKATSNVRFQVLGPLDFTYPLHITKEELEQDVADGVIEYLGVTDCVLPYLQQPGVVVVLPSFHEGLNRSLMEACSCGCPIITTDIPGCREVVKAGKNGFLVPPKEYEPLAEAMLKYHRMSIEEKGEFSRVSRTIAEQRFDMKLVINEYIKVLREAGVL